MTIEQIRSWSPEEKRLVIATACGWHSIKQCACKCARHGLAAGVTGDRNYRHLPDYLSDLNAMNEAEKVLKRDMNGLWYTYCVFLHEFTLGLGEGATAAQRADAFIVVVVANLVP